MQEKQREKKEKTIEKKSITFKKMKRMLKSLT